MARRQSRMIPASRSDPERPWNRHEVAQAAGLPVEQVLSWKLYPPHRLVVVTVEGAKIEARLP